MLLVAPGAGQTTDRSGMSLSPTTGIMCRWQEYDLFEIIGDIFVNIGFVAFHISCLFCNV